MDFSGMAQYLGHYVFWLQSIEPPKMPKTIILFDKSLGL